MPFTLSHSSLISVAAASGDAQKCYTGVEQGVARGIQDPHLRSCIDISLEYSERSEPFIP